jgi:acid phosphatase family membrane protein YuiD
MCCQRQLLLSLCMLCCPVLCLHPQIFTKYLKKGVWDLRAIVDSGGMPSSHSALCAVSGTKACMIGVHPPHVMGVSDGCGQYEPAHHRVYISHDRHSS